MPDDDDDDGGDNDDAKGESPLLLFDSNGNHTQQALDGNFSGTGEPRRQYLKGERIFVSREDSFVAMAHKGDLAMGAYLGSEKTTITSSVAFGIISSLKTAEGRMDLFKLWWLPGGITILLLLVVVCASVSLFVSLFVCDNKLLPFSPPPFFFRLKR